MVRATKDVLVTSTAAEHQHNTQQPQQRQQLLHGCIFTQNGEVHGQSVEKKKEAKL